LETGSLLRATDSDSSSPGSSSGSAAFTLDAGPDVSPTPVPEPSTLLLAALAGTVLAGRKRAGSGELGAGS
jgi:hypothetical protein